MGFVKYIRVQWDRVLAVFLALLGLLALWLGWVGVSSSVYPAQQLPYIISGGIFALFLLGGASTLWLSADLRDEWRHLDGLQRRVEEYVGTTIEQRVEVAVRSAVAATAASNGHTPPAPVKEPSVAGPSR